MAARILGRIGGIGAQRLGSMPSPAGVEHHAPCECDHVCLARNNDVFRLARLRDHADGNRGDSRLGLDAFGRGNLITRSQGNFLIRVVATRRDVDEIAALGLQFVGKGNAVVEGPATVHPVGR